MLTANFKLQLILLDTGLCVCFSHTSLLHVSGISLDHDSRIKCVSHCVFH